MEYLKALEIANKVLELLKPFCDRCEIAGSIRRQKPEVKDIEIVCIPKPYEHGLFEDGLATIVNKWQKVKGELEYGKCKYTQRILPEGIKLDLFFATHINWGLQFAIRTGDAEFSKALIGTILPNRGYKSESGLLIHSEVVCNVYEEVDLFGKAEVPYIEPKHRNITSLLKYLPAHYHY